MNIDTVIDTTADYPPGTLIAGPDGAMAATIVRVDEDEARVVVETPDQRRFYVYGDETFAFVDGLCRDVAARLPLGTKVQDDEDDRVGMIAEPTEEEVARGEAECCCFNPGSAYVLVEWSYPEYPEDGVEREWESPDDLRVLADSAAGAA